MIKEDELGAAGLARMLAGKPRYVDQLSRGACVYLRQGAGGGRSQESGRIAESDPNFVGKSMLALTVMRASYSRSDILDEGGIKSRLGVDVPAGFYLVGPDGKVAAGFFAWTEASGKPEPSLEAADWGAKLAKKKLLADPCWSTVVEYGLEAFAAAADPFADWLSAPEEAKASGVALHGIKARSRISGRGGPDILGYPAPLALPAHWMGDADQAEWADEAIPGEALQSRAAAPLRELWRLPFFNHNAASAINNARNIQAVADRRPDRAGMARALAAEWLERSNILRGFRDGSMASGQEILGGEEIKAMREREAKKLQRLSKVGKERIIYFTPNCTTSSGAGRERLTLSADIALVDGQHSSRDYWLLAHGFEAALDRSRSAPAIDGRSVPDCDPKHLAAQFKSHMASLCQDAGISPKEAAERGLSGKGAFEAFAEYVGGKSSWVEMRPAGSQEIARQNTIIENAQREQSKEDKALSELHSDAMAFIEAFNRGARAAGSRTRLTAVKSSHAEPEFSARAAGENIDIKDIFRCLSALAVPDGSMSSKNDHARSAVESDAQAWAAKDVKDLWPKLRAKDAAAARARFVAIYESLGGLKGRDFDLTAKRLSSTLAALNEDARLAPKSAGFVGVVNKLLAARFGLVKKAAERAAGNQDESAAKAYRIGLAAIELSSIMDLSWEPKGKSPTPEERDRKGGNEKLRGFINQSTLESLLLRMASDRYRKGGPDESSIASEQMFGFIRESMDRLRSLAMAGSIEQINGVRDSIAKQKVSDERGLGGYIAAQGDRAKTLFDAAPTPGLSFDQYQELSDERSALAKAASVAGKLEAKRAAAQKAGQRGRAPKRERAQGERGDA